MTPTPITGQTCAYPGCDQPAATHSGRGAKPKYCANADHNPLTAHRERRRRDAEKTGHRAEETGGQPVTFGITRAAELVRSLETLTAQHADVLARAVTELRAAGDLESAEAEVYAARTSADQRVATAEARVAEEMQRRREAEADRDQADADRQAADDATAQAIARMEELERDLAALRASTAAELRQNRADAAAEIEQARADAQREIEQVRAEAGQRVAEMAAKVQHAETEATRARKAETAAITRADHAQAQAADEAARIRADAERERGQLQAATDARLAALEETRDALRIRAERAEADLDTARSERQGLAEQLTAVLSATEPDSAPVPAPHPRAATRTKKAPGTRTPGQS